MQLVSTILAIVAALVSVAVGIVVWRGERRNKYRRSFVWLAAFVSAWILSNVIYGLVDGELRYLFALVSYAAAMLLAVQLLVFCLRFVYTKLNAGRLFVIILPGMLAAAISAVPGIIATGVEGYTIQTNSLALRIYGAILIGYLVSACLVLITRSPKLAFRSRQIVGVIFLGISASAIVGAYFNLILPLSGVYEFTQLGPAGAVLFVGSVAYAIVKHGLFDVRLAVVRSVTYFMVLATMAGVYFIIAWLLSGLLKGVVADPTAQVVNLGIALFLAIILQPIKRFFDKVTNSIFYRDNYSAEEFFARLSRELNSSTDLRGLLQSAALEIGGTLKAEQSFFFVRYGDGRYMTAGTERHTRVNQAEIDDLDRLVTMQRYMVIVTDRLDEKDPLYRLLHKQKIALTLPLLQGDQIIGYLFLGSQRSRDYTRRDIRALETVSDELVIAIQNALSVQEVKEINATLQDRIKSATKELRRTNLQLQRLDAAKDEFVSMASHQLRTPLTSVKGYISMVLEGDVGRISSTQRQLLGEAFTSSERMVHLINDFLNVSRLQTGKFIVESRPIDLAKLVGQEVDSLKTTAGAHELQLGYRKPPYFPVLMIDEGKIRQVVMNFIDNAIYYSHEGTTIDVKLYIDGGDAVLEVHDTGIGVPKSEQAHLFGKFFRATNARRQRPDGTGVGLFLAKKVIDAHGGAIVFHSVEGQGSVFGFRLPIKRLRADDQAHELGQ